MLVTVQAPEDETAAGAVSLGSDVNGTFLTLYEGLVFRFFTSQAAERLLTAAGFRILEMEEFGRPDVAHAHRPYEHVHRLIGALCARD